jgi:hypothetical protein
MASKTKREFPVKPAEGQDESYDPTSSLIPGAQKPKSPVAMRSRAGTRSGSSIASARIEPPLDSIEKGGTSRLRSRHHSAAVFNTPLSTEQSSLAFSFGKSAKLPGVDSQGKNKDSLNPSRGVPGTSGEIANICVSVLVCHRNMHKHIFICVFIFDV